MILVRNLRRDITRYAYACVHSCVYTQILVSFKIIHTRARTHTHNLYRYNRVLTEEEVRVRVRVCVCVCVCVRECVRVCARAPTPTLQTPTHSRACTHACTRTHAHRSPPHDFVWTPTDPLRLYGGKKSPRRAGGSSPIHPHPPTHPPTPHTHPSQRQEEREESGWKLVHTDVFRPPPNYPMVCVRV